MSYEIDSAIKTLPRKETPYPEGFTAGFKKKHLKTS
jgi:hypothetical protein